MAGRRAEIRPGEQIGMTLFQAIAPLLFGAARKYQPITADQVAKTMIAVAVGNKNSDSKGLLRYPSDKIAALAKVACIFHGSPVIPQGVHYEEL